MAHKYDYRHAYRVRRRHWPVHPAVPDEITIEPESPAGEDPPAAEDLTVAPPASDNELFSDREQPVRPSPAQVLVRIVIPARGFDRATIAGARPFTARQRVILTVDRLTRWAGIHRIISALPALGPSYAVVVAGTGRGRGMLEAHADYLQVADQVRFLGAVSDEVLHRWLRTASVIATLKEESLWGGTLLTAACARVPIIASDIPANREAAAQTSRDGIEFVSRRASPFAIADAVRRLTAPGTGPRAEVVPSWENVGERTVSIYAELLRHER